MAIKQNNSRHLRIPSNFFLSGQDDTYIDILKCARKLNNDSRIFINKEKRLKVYEILNEKNKEHERIIPLLYGNAIKLNFEYKLTNKCRTLLKTYTQKAIITEIGRKKQTQHIIDSFESENIPIILLKGSAFSETIYKSNAPRASNDVDILVKSEHWELAISCLNKLMKYQPKTKPDYFGDYYEISFIPHSNMGAAVDLHKSLLHPELFSVREDELWSESAEHPSYQNSRVRVLCPEHALIHQALHAYKDMNFCKYNLVDTYNILSLENIDMNKLCSIAESWGTKVPLFVLLFNAREILGSKIDMNVMKELKPNFLIRYMCSTLLSSKHRQPIATKKTILYRLNQMLAQYSFCNNLFGPLKLQLKYMTFLVKDKFSKLRPTR